jgi:hypothetical protein
LIDLLFKAHLERDGAFDIEIIDWDSAGERVKENYGFLPGIRTMSQLSRGSESGDDPREPLIPESAPDNPFKTWLKYKGIDIVGADAVQKTRGGVPLTVEG